MSQTTITFPLQVALAGQLADTLDNDCLPYTSVESSALIPFGVMLRWVSAGAAGDYSCANLSSSSDVLVGPSVLSFVYDDGPNGELVNVDPTGGNNVGLKPKTTLNVLRKGRIYVLVEEAVNANDRAFVRFAVSTAFPNGLIGGFRKSQDATGPSSSNTCIDVTDKCQYLTSASAGGFAVLDVNMLIK